MRSTVVVVVAVLLFVGCATGSDATIRDLPVNLQPVGRLLDGCEHGLEGDGAVARCHDDLVFRVREVEAQEGSAPRYLGDGVDLANANAGRMVWDTVAFPTAVDTGVVDRGQVRAVDDDDVIVILYGAARRSADQRMQKEISCQAPPSESTRCAELLTAFLDLPAADAKRVPATVTLSQGSIYGRAVSLPTTCSIIEQKPDHGRYACDDDAQLYWLVTDEMEDAATQAEAALSALADGEDRKSTPCALLNTDAQCELTAGALVGLGYLDAKPIVVVCVAPDPFQHGLCKSSFRRP